MAKFKGVEIPLTRDELHRVRLALGDVSYYLCICVSDVLNWRRRWKFSNFLGAIGISVGGYGFEDEPLGYTQHQWVLDLGPAPHERRLGLLDSLIAAYDAEVQDV